MLRGVYHLDRGPAPAARNGKYACRRGATDRVGRRWDGAGRRVGNVDVLRAVAALMVLAGHAYFLSGRTVTVIAERWYDVLIIAGASGVWLFFAISGYVIGRPFIDRLVTGRAAAGPSRRTRCAAWCASTPCTGSR